MNARRTQGERIQALEHSIYGNGAIGIKQQIHEIRYEFIEDIKIELKEIRDNQTKIQRLYWMGFGAVSVLSPIVTTLFFKLIK